MDTIENPRGGERGVEAAMVDGRGLAVANGVARVPLVRDGKGHHVTLRMGSTLGKPRSSGNA